MKNFYINVFFLTIAGLLISVAQENSTVLETSIIKPSRIEVVTPIRKQSFDNDGTCKERKQGGNPKTISGYLVFDGANDGKRQVDPQIAVGGGYILHGTNRGLIIYDKKGNYIKGVSQNCFNKGIDPKLFYDVHNKVFGFDLWNPWDKKVKEEREKPVNISISETNDPTGAWNTYPVPAPNGRDGGAIGYSKKWIGYSYPGRPGGTFVLKMEEAKAGKSATIYHFSKNLGEPIKVQDTIDELYFLKATDNKFIVNRIYTNKNGIPVCETTEGASHGLKYVGFPPKSPQKNTVQLVASGGKNPKAITLQNGYIWFSRIINLDGIAAVEWYQINLDGSIVQTGIITKKGTSYIQSSLAVNKNNDVLIGFQETNKEMYISPRMAYRKASDPKGTVREIVNIGEGKGFTDGTAWGDYSGCIIDGDNLMDLWTIQSITDEGGNGDTVIAKVPFRQKK